MAHLQYMPGDPRLVDQLVYELKSKGIFDQFRKDCIADVDTRPAYQNLRQRVESSVSTFLSRQCWKPDLNKNQLREKLRKHILDGNYLEQGVERIVDQVVNPKVASVFIPQVEDLVYNYLGIERKKTVTAETSNEAVDLLPTDLEAVSPGSVKSNNDKDDENKEEINMDVDDDSKLEIKEDSMTIENDTEKFETPDSSSVVEVKSDPELSMDCSIPLPAGEIKPEDIVTPKNSPTKEIKLPGELLPSDIPLPDEIPKTEKDLYFKPITSEDDSSSDSSLRRNMSPLTPVRNFENENSCDAQQGFDNDSVEKVEEKNSPSTFKFDIEAKSSDSSDVKVEKKEEQTLSYQFNNQININTYNMYEESSNSNNLLIDYESDANSKTNIETKPDIEQNLEVKKEKKVEEKRSSHKSSHRSRDSHRHSSSKDKMSDSKHSSRDSSRHDKKSSKDESKSKSSDKDKAKNKSEKNSKDSKDSRQRTSHKSSSHRDSKSHRSSSSSQRHSSKHTDDKKSSSSKEKSEKSSDKSSKDRSRDSKSSSHRSDRDRKSSSKKHDEKDKKEKKETDDHYSLSGRNNNNRRSTDRDSNDGSSSSKGSNNRTSNFKSSDAKKDSKGSSSKSEPTSNSSDNISPSDKEKLVKEASKSPKSSSQGKPIVRVDTHLEIPFASPPRLPFVPDVTLKKPKYAANMEEAKRLMKMRKFMEEEQKRMNQEAALLLEFQANVRPSLSQVYSSIPGPELEFACVQHIETATERNQEIVEEPTDSITQALTEMHEGSDIQNVPSEYVDEVNNTSIEAQLTGIDDLNNVIESSSIETDEITIVELDTLDKTEEENLAETSVEDSKIKDDVLNAQVIEDKDVLPSIIPRKELSNTESTESDDTLKYFAEQEKVNAELERYKFSSFLKSFTERNQSNKMYLINCNTYEENILKEAAESFGSYEVMNYFRNGHLKLAKPKNIVKVNVSTEINIPLGNDALTSRSTVFSPVKSECSFELSSEYDTMEDIMTKTSRQQIMEIILGNATVDEMPTTIVYCNESNIEDNSLKRKHEECSVNNNRTVLTPNKIRKISDSDQISSTTEEVVAPLNNNQIQSNFRSKYLGKARRVGLSRPKKISLPNSPSSDKSVENYENPTSVLSTPNGKMKTPRSKVQRYATSDLYKPKLHYLSRRNNIT